MQVCLRVDRRLRPGSRNFHSPDQEPPAPSSCPPTPWKPYLSLPNSVIIADAGRRRGGVSGALARNPACFAAVLPAGGDAAAGGADGRRSAVYGAALQHAPPPGLAAQMRAEQLSAKERTGGGKHLRDAISSPHGVRQLLWLHRALAA